MSARTSRLLLATASLLLSLLVVELLLRFVIEPSTHTNFTAVPRDIRMDPPFPGVPYLLRPNAAVKQDFFSDDRGYFDEDATLTYRTNSRGFRGPEVKLRKPEKIFRIVGLGDSFTFGTGVRERDTFLASLRGELAELSEPRFEVVNLGVMGFDTFAEVSLLRYLGVRYQPDLVVICLTLGDAGGGPIHRAFNRRFEADQLPTWRRVFHTAHRVTALVESRLALRDLIASYERTFAPGAAGRARVRGALEHARDLGKSAGFRVALMIFPVLWELSGDYPFESVHHSVAELASEVGIPVLDLRPAFDGYDGPELWVHPSNQHPNEVAHAIAGRALMDFLRSEALLPGG